MLKTLIKEEESWVKRHPNDPRGKERLSSYKKQLAEKMRRKFMAPGNTKGYISKEYKVAAEGSLKQHKEYMDKRARAFHDYSPKDRQ